MWHCSILLFLSLLISHHSIRIETIKDMRSTRDILYVSGQIITGDTLHVFVVHAPSRAGGERVHHYPIGWLFPTNYVRL